MGSVADAKAGAGRELRVVLEGPLVATVTPFRVDGSVDEDALQAYLQYLWDTGIRSILVNGTTAEFPSMTLVERKAAAEAARRAWKGTLINNISATAVADCRELLHHSAFHLPGSSQAVADAVLMLPPYYFADQSDAGIEAFLRAVLAGVSIPFFFYNFRAHTGNFIGPAVYASMAADFPLLQGVKASMVSMEEAGALAAAAPGLQVVLGNDHQALPALRAGLTGSVTANCMCAPAHVAMYKAFQDGDVQACERLQATISDWIKFVESLGCGEISATKVALDAVLAGGFPAAVRPPLVEASDSQKARIQQQAVKVLREQLQQLAVARPAGLRPEV